MGRGGSRGGARLVLVAALAAFGTLTVAPSVPSASAAVPTTPASIGYGADQQGTSWFQGQTQLTHESVTSSTFGRRFATQTTAKGYPQPLDDKGTLLIENSNNDIYGMNATTGTIKWRQHLGKPFDPFTLGCGATEGDVGVTGTPVVDTSTDVEYFVYKLSTGQNYMDARHVATGLEVPGFPVAIQGDATNAPGVAFNSTAQLQRPGLILLNGVVYAAFGSHCDRSVYEGWVVGVSEAGAISTMWCDETATGDDGGIWQGGGALISDGPNTMLLSTGNGDIPTGPAHSGQDPGDYGNAVVRLTIAPGGALSPSDFFIPYDAAYLNTIDGDLGSGAPVVLPSTPFSSANHPHLAVEMGKEGYLYLLDADNLGGYEQGTGEGDAVIERLGPFGGLWGKPAVYGGAGGYVYLVDSSSIGGSGRLLAFKFGIDADGRPSLAQVGQSTDAFAYGSSSPIVTTGTSPNGSGIVWVVWTPETNSQTAELRAYSAVPDDSGTLDLLRSFPLDDGAEKMTEPLAVDNDVYVVGLTGKVYCFGSPVTTPLAVNPLFLPSTTIGRTSTGVLAFTATATHTLSAPSSSDPQFTLGTPKPTLPAVLTKGQVLDLPVTFTPTAEGEQGSVITVLVDGTPFTVGAEGAGVAAGPELTVSPRALSFGGTSPGQTVTSGISISDTGSAPLTIAGVTLPDPPFLSSGLPSAGTVLQPGQSVTGSLSFAPTSIGMFTGSLTVDAGPGGSDTVQLSGSSASPGQLTVTPNLLKFGTVPLGTVVTQSFTVSNTGGTALVITKSQPPVANRFRATTALSEGSALSPGESLTETVTFSPVAAGTFHDKWVINGTGMSTAVQVQLVGTGA